MHNEAFLKEKESSRNKENLSQLWGSYRQKQMAAWSSTYSRSAVDTSQWSAINPLELSNPCLKL
ncbi:hypothetical protein O9992_20060 [Vibrio lentus]|nr:hypothetical protein [Vibrio lentus]